MRAIQRGDSLAQVFVCYTQFCERGSRLRPALKALDKPVITGGVTSLQSSLQPRRTLSGSCILTQFAHSRVSESGRKSGVFSRAVSVVRVGEPGVTSPHHLATRTATDASHPVSRPASDARQLNKACECDWFSIDSSQAFKRALTPVDSVSSITFHCRWGVAPAIAECVKGTQQSIFRICPQDHHPAIQR